MTTTIEYALLSANVYGNKNEITAPDDTVRTTRNTLPVPDGWSVLDQQFRSDGFILNPCSLSPESSLKH